MASLQLKVQLEGINPLIWRTFQIDQTETFFDLHEILQIVMGWENAHLFEFQIKERKIGLLPDEEEMWDTDANLEDSEFDVEKICRTMGISRTVLYDKVTAITGKSVGEFIRKMRLETAAKILVTENLPVNLVMDRVGIQSPSYFSKAFKKEFGKTPSQYLTDFLGEQKPKAKIKV